MTIQLGVVGYGHRASKVIERLRELAPEDMGAYERMPPGTVFSFR